MLTLEVNMADQKVREALQAAASAVSPESAAKVCAEAGADVVRSHFVDLSRSRHRQGQRINYYLQAADSVTSDADGGEAFVRIPHTGIAQRYYGGVISPSGRISPVTGKPVTRLAIGIKGTPGEGHTPADFADLFVSVRKGSKKDGDKGNAYLAVKSGESVQYLFTLVTRVEQAAAPSVLPENGKILNAAADGILDLYDAVMEKNK